MTETYKVHDPFIDEDVQISSRMVDRLRGKYAQGPMKPNGEPEFGWREFPTVPIQVEAANEIEGLQAEVEDLTMALHGMVDNFKPFTMRHVGAPNSSARAEQIAQIAAHAAAVAVLADSGSAS